MSAAFGDTQAMTELLIGDASSSSPVITSTATIAAASQTFKTTVASTKVSSAGSSVSASASSCPSLDGQDVINNGKNYTIACKTDHLGGDATYMPGTSITSRLTSCSNYAGCLDVVYAIEEGLCWIKTTINPASANSEVIAGVVNSGSSALASTRSGTALLVSSPSHVLIMVVILGLVSLV